MKCQRQEKVNNADVICRKNQNVMNLGKKKKIRIKKKEEKYSTQEQHLLRIKEKESLEDEPKKYYDTCYILIRIATTHLHSYEIYGYKQQS